jgi:ATP-dependent Lon protease
MDEALGIALARKLEPIEWDEAAALAAAQLQGLSAPVASDGDGAALPH